MRRVGWSVARRVHHRGDDRRCAGVGGLRGDIHAAFESDHRVWSDSGHIVSSDVTSTGSTSSQVDLEDPAGVAGDGIPSGGQDCAAVLNHFGALYG